MACRTVDVWEVEGETCWKDMVERLRSVVGNYMEETPLWEPYL
jgi:hypothetical protein